jgi:hypothetical protein
MKKIKIENMLFEIIQHKGFTKDIVICMDKIRRAEFLELGAEDKKVKIVITFNDNHIVGKLSINTVIAIKEIKPCPKDKTIYMAEFDILI